MRLFVSLWRANPANARHMAVCLSLVLCMALAGGGVDTWREMPEGERVAVRGNAVRAKVSVARSYQATARGAEGARRFVGRFLGVR